MRIIFFDTLLFVLRLLVRQKPLAKFKKEQKQKAIHTWIEMGCKLRDEKKKTMNFASSSSMTFHNNVSTSDYNCLSVGRSLICVRFDCMWECKTNAFTNVQFAVFLLVVWLKCAQRPTLFGFGFQRQKFQRKKEPTPNA